MSALLFSLVVGLFGVPPGQDPKPKMPPMATMTPFMYAKDFAKYKPGVWVEYDYGMMSQTFACVDKKGSITWIQVGLKMQGLSYEHLLKVNGKGKVLSAWFSSEGYGKWEKCKINDTPVSKRPRGGDCALCKKPIPVHKRPDTKVTDEVVVVAGKKIHGKKLDLTSYKCDGTQAFTGTYWFSPAVPELHQMYRPMLQAAGLEGLGSLVRAKMGASKVACIGFGKDAKPKHILPEE